MNLLADESVDAPIVRQLHADGHQVGYIDEMAKGISDDAVLQAANQDGAVLITADKDFGEMVYRQHLIAAGVILVRLNGLSASLKARIVCKAVADLECEFRGAFSVISPTAVRIRRTLGG